MKEFPAYDPAAIEAKWQAHWEKTNAFAAESSHEKPKFYPLIEFPYPSAAGLHVGHPRSNTAMDIIARKRRMEGSGRVVVFASIDCRRFRSVLPAAGGSVR